MKIVIASLPGARATGGACAPAMLGAGHQCRHRRAVAPTGLIDSGLLFTTTGAVQDLSLAKFVILELLYFHREMPRLQRMQRVYHWEHYTNRKLAGWRTLVVELSTAGRSISQRLAALFQRGRSGS